MPNTRRSADLDLVEPALPIPSFVRHVSQAPRDHGYAIVETGQFQIYIGEFAPTSQED